STMRIDSTRLIATARRKLVVNFTANVRASPCACGRTVGAAETERSAHSAVATTITAITCLVRRRIGPGGKTPMVNSRSARVLRCREAPSRTPTIHTRTAAGGFARDLTKEQTNPTYPYRKVGIH